MDRTAGLLLPIAALPGPYGIGNFSEEAAKQLAKFLNNAGIPLLSILPFGHMERDNGCPYQAISDSPDPVYIDPAGLIEMGLISPERVAEIYAFEKKSTNRVNYAEVRALVYKVLKEAVPQFPWTTSAEFQQYCQNPYISDYADFMLCRELYGSTIAEWPDSIRLRDLQTLNDLREEHTDQIKFWKVVSFIAQMQYDRFRKTLQEYGISIFGDIPFYYALNSQEVWTHPECFAVNPNTREMVLEAGAPPDKFAKDGQHWQNPCYLEYLPSGELNPAFIALCKERTLRASMKYDFLRLDHFRAHDSPWKWDIEGNGKPYSGAGIILVEMLKAIAAENQCQLIAEDLGDMSYGNVPKLMADSGIPGMRVAAFSVAEGNVDQFYEECPERCVVYTGTHDNETIRDSIRKANKSLRPEEIEQSALQIIRGVLGTKAEIVILSFVDVFNLPRYNEPGTDNDHNWTVRITKFHLHNRCAWNLLQLVARSGRVNGCV